MTLREVSGRDVYTAIRETMAEELGNNTISARFAGDMAGHGFLYLQRVMNEAGFVFARETDVTKPDGGSLSGS